MKTQNRTVVVAVVGFAAMFLSQARAQIRTGGGDGIAASPKVRVMREEWARPAAVPDVVPAVLVATYRPVEADNIAASPKIREMLIEAERNRVVMVPAPAVVSAGYRPTGADGIAASPKLRQQLDERGGAVFQVAPVR